MMRDFCNVFIPTMTIPSRYMISHEWRRPCDASHERIIIGKVSCVRLVRQHTPQSFSRRRTRACFRLRRTSEIWISPSAFLQYDMNSWRFWEILKILDGIKHTRMARVGILKGIEIEEWSRRQPSISVSCTRQTQSVSCDVEIVQLWYRVCSRLAVAPRAKINLKNQRHV